MKTINFLKKWFVAVFTLFLLIADVYVIIWALKRSYEFFEITIIQDASLLLMLFALNLAFYGFAKKILKD